MVEATVAARDVGLDDVLLGPLVINARGIFEMEGRQCVTFVTRDRIVNLAFCHGSLAERPVLQCLLGLLFVPTALFFGVMAPKAMLWAFIGHFLFTGRARFRGDFSGSFAFCPLGAWMIYDALRRGPFVGVDTPSHRRKLRLHSRCTPAELEAALGEAHIRFGYPTPLISRRP